MLYLQLGIARATVDAPPLPLSKEILADQVSLQFPLLISYPGHFWILQFLCIETAHFDMHLVDRQD